MRWSRRIGRDQKMCVLVGRPATRRSGRSFELRMLIGCYGPRPAGNAMFSVPQAVLCRRLHNRTSRPAGYDMVNLIIAPTA